MIEIKKNPFGDTRTCDVSQVERLQFDEANYSHINDVDDGLEFFVELLRFASAKHDWDKVTEPDASTFFDDFKHKFAEGHTEWWDNHRKIHRHHLGKPYDGIPDDVNLVDIIEYIVDCVMAGMARTGTVYEIEASDELLRKAFNNTIELLKQNVKVLDGRES